MQKMLMKKSSDYTLITLLLDASQKLGLGHEELGKIIAKCVLGEPTKNSFAKLKNYHRERAEKLRDKIYSVLREIEQKGRDQYIKKIESEIKKNIKNIPCVSSNWWYTIYSVLFEQFNSYKEKQEKDLGKKFEEYYPKEETVLNEFLKKFFEEGIITKVLLNNVLKKVYPVQVKEATGKEQLKSMIKVIKEEGKSIEKMREEYKTFINTFLNVVRNFEKLEKIIEI
ncbi:MAG: hypothetical protein NZ889_00555 [Candidatus Pacearchaeota archaeon]|nr:hypothetical protein [Candidatus Pacearchaeota archaeon]